MARSVIVGDIYDTGSYQPRKSVGALLSRVRVEMLAALDRELEADKRLAPLELSAAQFIIIANLASASEPLSASDLCKGISYDAGAMTEGFAGHRSRRLGDELQRLNDTTVHGSRP